ncbi:DUF411 domain-containing protein [Allohahella marinimesophila]|uniref:DUF411 domain-containing protein n=2 Tax=Allohahella marinimesophila TaxID=1054972 RepID=A0ABP7NJS8_9GAMM
MRGLTLTLLLGAGGANAAGADAEVVEVYKTPWCGCCADWVDHMSANGFEVKVHQIEDLAPIKQKFGVPTSLQSCHTAEIGGYTFEGHVPAEDVHRVLKEKPDVKGLAVPGMPIGSPGMETGGAPDKYDVIQFGEKGQAVYSSHVGLREPPSQD